MRILPPLLLLSALLASAETIDRIVIVVARHPITELQLEEELRVTAFLNEKPLSTGAAQRCEAADRLIDQALVQREMQLTRFPLPTDDAVNSAYQRLEEEQGGSEKLSQLLSEYELNPSEVRTHLALQIATLRFIAFRFRPELGIQENAVEQAYAKERETWRADHPGQPIPTFEASRGSLRRQLLEQQTDRAMSEWLEQTRKQVRIAYLDSTLETPKR